MIVYFTTVVRAAPVAEGGELIKLDWQTKTVLARVPILPTDPEVPDLNSRGSTRGGRGILVDDAHVYAASYHSVLVFDHDLNLEGRITHPLFVDLHEICWQDGAIWASATRIDGAIKVDLNGEQLASWWPREDPVTAGALGLEPNDLDKTADHRTSVKDFSKIERSHVHLNAMDVQDGRPVMLLNRYGVVAKLDPTEVVVRDPALRGAHNVLAASDGSIVVNNTAGRAVHVYAPDGRLIRRIDLLGFWPVRRHFIRHLPAVVSSWLYRRGRPSRVFTRLFAWAEIAKPIFVRGLCETPAGTVLVGISPATILEIDYRRGRLVDAYVFSGDRYVCVHGLTQAP